MPRPEPNLTFMLYNISYPTMDGKYFYFRNILFLFVKMVFIKKKNSDLQNTKWGPYNAKKMMLWLRKYFWKLEIEFQLATGVLQIEYSRDPNKHVHMLIYSQTKSHPLAFFHLQQVNKISNPHVYSGPYSYLGH